MRVAGFADRTESTDKTRWAGRAWLAFGMPLALISHLGRSNIYTSTSYILKSVRQLCLFNFAHSTDSKFHPSSFAVLLQSSLEVYDELTRDKRARMRKELGLSIDSLDPDETATSAPDADSLKTANQALDRIRTIRSEAWHTTTARDRAAQKPPRKSR